mgnify:CR=1 FL=1
MSGFFAVGIAHGKTSENIGTLWRSAYAFGAAVLFTVGARYKKQSSDTPRTDCKIPLLHFTDIDDLVAHLPAACPLIGVEMADQAKDLWAYIHLPRAAYLLGGEDCGLSAREQARCHGLIQIDSRVCLNVATAGSIVMFHRAMQLRPQCGSLRGNRTCSI